MNEGIDLSVVALSFSAIASLLLGATVLWRNVKSSLHRNFFYLAIASSVWALTNLLFVILDSQRYLYALVSYGAAAILVLMFLLFCIILSGTRLKAVQLAGVIIPGVLAAIIAMTPGVIAFTVTDDLKIVTNQIPLLAFGLYVAVTLTGGIVIMLRSRKRMNPADRNRHDVIIAGLVCAAVLGVIFNFIFPVFDEYGYVRLGPTAILIFMAATTYAIVKHRLFDIKLAAIRTVAYVCVLITLAGLYYAVAYIISSVAFGERTAGGLRVDSLDVILALLLAGIFQPVKNFFDRLSNDIFYRQTYSSDAFYERLSQLLSSTTDLRSILERASTEIADTLKAEQAMFFLYYTNGTNHYISAGTKGHKRMPIADARTLDEFAEALNHDDRLIVTEHIIDNEPIRRLLLSHKIALLMPLRYNKRLIGYLTLGDHRGGGYSQRDLRTLTTILNEIVIAIQNALSIQEVREINATLKQRVDIATKELRSSNAQLRRVDEVKDEFISMASHQLRTPLTSVKGYISMVLEGDVGKVTPMQKQLLSEAFNSSERMVRLIGDFLNVSRLQTGKFVIDKAPTDLVDLVQQEVSGLKLIAASRGQNIVFRKPDALDAIAFDESKMRQVVMNFIDNAIYYSKDNTTITVVLEVKGADVEFTVKDTGIGVPKEEQANLFRKFFRATNARKARPDGTGVGLFLAKKVVSAHGGSMIFTSKEGEGSVFGFRIPVKQDV